MQVENQIDLILIATMLTEFGYHFLGKMKVTHSLIYTGCHQLLPILFTGETRLTKKNVKSNVLGNEFYLLHKDCQVNMNVNSGYSICLFY